MLLNSEDVNHGPPKQNVGIARSCVISASVAFRVALPAAAVRIRSNAEKPLMRPMKA
jgi:hypothetical protein